MNFEADSKWDIFGSEMDGNYNDSNDKSSDYDDGHDDYDLCL